MSFLSILALEFQNNIVMFKVSAPEFVQLLNLLNFTLLI